ncbi:hypothetical protein IGX29_00720 [Streptomyces sp. H28]|uniref:DUF6192 family protein n=1 Tax=unclassified Streptomyces TaxID=2593676 RepID=UPI00177DD5BB|nr:DUF6192 family protein [Streptomyces sp. H28]MBD9730359.1 hypothetical protein [Streptomyces sp. H28]MBM7087191.1 hypothetical protein [Streptomyces sp. S12]
MTETLTAHSEIEDWADKVSEGQRLTGSEGSVQFRLGDLGLSLAPLPPKGKRLPMKAYKLLADFAEEIGQPRERFEEYRLVAGAWPKPRRNRQVCWTVHATLARHPDRFIMINNPPLYRKSGQRRWTCDAARKAMGWSSGERDTDEDKLRQVEDLLADEQVAAVAVERVMQREPVLRRVAQRQPVREAFNRAQVEEMRTAHEETRRLPEVQRINEEAEVLTVLGLCHSFAHGIGRALPGLHLAELSDEAKDSVREGLERVTAAVGWTEHVLETGRTDMDEALERLIAGEG